MNDVKTIKVLEEIGLEYYKLEKNLKEVYSDDQYLIEKVCLIHREILNKEIEILKKGLK